MDGSHILCHNDWWIYWEQKQKKKDYDRWQQRSIVEVKTGRNKILTWKTQRLTRWTWTIISCQYLRVQSFRHQSDFRPHSYILLIARRMDYKDDYQTIRVSDSTKRTRVPTNREKLRNFDFSTELHTYSFSNRTINLIILKLKWWYHDDDDFDFIF